MALDANCRAFYDRMVEPDELIPEDMQHSLLSLRGKYSINNGVVALVDRSGNMFVGKADELTIELLGSLGMLPGEFYVPHSNDGGLWLCLNHPKKVSFMREHREQLMAF